MKYLAVILLMAQLAAQVNCTGIWPFQSDYQRFAVMKSCFGEDVALKAEKIVFDSIKDCLLKYTNNGTDPIELLANQPEEFIGCTRRNMNTLTEDNNVNYTHIEKWLEDNISDPILKTDLLRVSSMCKDLAPLWNLFSLSSTPKTVLQGDKELKSYYNCLQKSGAFKACRNSETRRYAHLFGLPPNGEYAEPMTL